MSGVRASITVVYMRNFFISISFETDSLSEQLKGSLKKQIKEEHYGNV